ncbi:MAG: type I restriction-modification system methyltransferase subunit, partial [bacterium]
NQISWVIVINENEIESINPKEAESGKSFLWKLALWGNYRDKKAINKLQKLFRSTLNEFDDEIKKRKLCRGLDLKNNSNPQEVDHLPEITGKRVFDPNLIEKHRFSIPEAAFSFISPEKSYVRRRSGQEGLALIQAPHIVINPQYCIFSDQDFIIPDSQVGISTTKEESDLLRALSVFLSSTIIRYYLFFCSASWGIGRGKVNPQDIKNIPIPNFTEPQVKELAKLQEQLAEMESSKACSSSELQSMLDDKIERILKLPKSLSILASDFINIKLTLNTGNRVLTPATKEPSKVDLQSYGECLRTELDDFIGDGKTHHKVSIIYSKSLVICTVEILYSETVMDISIIQISQDDTKLQKISEKLKQKFSQWIYIQRSLFIKEESRLHILKSPQLINWTRSQALKDSDEVISEILANSRNTSEVAS